MDEVVYMKVVLAKDGTRSIAPAITTMLVKALKPLSVDLILIFTAEN